MQPLLLFLAFVLSLPAAESVHDARFAAAAERGRAAQGLRALLEPLMEGGTKG